MKKRSPPHYLADEPNIKRSATQLSDTRWGFETTSGHASVPLCRPRISIFISTVQKKAAVQRTTALKCHLLLIFSTYFIIFFLLGSVDEDQI
jgi:hypothetical protein